MKQIVGGFLLAIQFLTTVPYRKSIPWTNQTAKWSVRSFPFIGLIAGILLVLQVLLLMEYTPFSALSISLWILFFGVLFTGGLHLDGWMDMSDAVFSYRDKERKLEIMSDSRVGAFGVISVLFLLSFRFLFIYEILQETPQYAIVLIGLIPFLARAAVALLLITGKSAKQTGRAAAYNGLLGKNDVFFVVFFVILFCGLVVFLDFHLLLSVGILVGSFVLLYIFAKHFYYQQFGGITGDMLGALSEGEETFLWFILWLLHSYAMV